MPTWFSFFVSFSLFCFGFVWGRNLKLFVLFLLLFFIWNSAKEFSVMWIWGLSWLSFSGAAFYIMIFVSFTVLLCISDLDTGFVDKRDNVVSEASRGSNSHKPQRDRTWSGKHKGRREGARPLHVQSQEHPLAWRFCLGCMVQLCFKSSISLRPLDP